MTNCKTILISQFPLPYHKIASWTNMYNYLLRQPSHGFDVIICPVVQEKADGVTYQILRDSTFSDKLKSKLFNKDKRYLNYLEALEPILDRQTNYVIHIVDNSGIVVPIHRYITKNYNRQNFYIQYYYQGFSPIFPQRKSNPLLEAVDELFFLTHLSYEAFIRYYDDCTFKARVLYNATDSNIFKIIPKDQKHKLRKAHKISSDKIIFMWCSQDRPKKGLHIALEAFKEVHQNNENTELLVVGVNRKISQKGVRVIGRVPNAELPKYYQMSDVYVFPSLWKEGFGIVLAEALKCGCYCIASNQGGIPEVLNFGKYGVLIDNPNFISEWVTEMEKAITYLKQNGKNPFLKEIDDNLYDLNDWCEKIKMYLQEAKLSFQSDLNE